MSDELERSNIYTPVKVHPPVELPLEEVLKGRKLISIEEAVERGNDALASPEGEGDTPMFLGGVRIPSKTNVYYSGLTQHGKTSTMKVTLYEVIKRISEGSKEKLILFASSSEFIPFVYAFAGKAPVYLMNPSDARCYQWDLSKDIESTSNTLDFSHTFVNEREGDTPFFNEGARSLLGGVINAFFLSVVKESESIDWTLADIANAIRTEQRIKAVLGLQPKDLNYIAENFLDRQNKDVLASLTARTQQLQNVAHLWASRPKFSLREFLDPMKEGGVLILGEDADNKATVLEINRLLIERMGKMLADREECKEARYWFFLDEFQKLGKMDTLKGLVKDGLKRGIRIHLASQNTADIIATYGREDANVLFWECGTHLVFHHSHHDSAQEAIKVFGMQQKRRWLRGNSFSISKQSVTSSGTNEGAGRSVGAGGVTTNQQQGKNEGVSDSISATISSSQNENIVEENAVKTQDLSKLKKGEFYAVSSLIDNFWKNRFVWESLKQVVEAQSDKPEHVRKVERSQKEKKSLLKDWEDEDYQRLGISKEVAQGQSTTVTATQKLKGSVEAYLQELNQRFGG